jgi:hypothetical protein
MEDDSPIFGTLFYKDIFKCIQFLLAHLPFKAHLNFEPVRLIDSEGHGIYSEMNRGNWWCDSQDQLPAQAEMVPVICTSDKTHWTNSSGDHHAWLLYLMIANTPNDIRLTPKSAPGFLSGCSHVPRKVPKSLMKHSIPWLELCCLNSGILRSLAPA